MTVTDIRPAPPAFSAQPTEWLESEVCVLAGHIAAAMCRFLLLVGELDRRESWRVWECLSCAHWLAWKCGISSRTAREHVRVARALEELPVITAAFSAGELSYSKVRALTRVATPKSETDLVEVAKHGTATHVDRIAAGYCQARRNADPDRARAQQQRRGVWHETDDDGTVTITMRLAPDAAATVLAAIDAATQVVPQPIDAVEVPILARRADAVELLACVYLEPDEHRAPATELVVHGDLATLVDDEPGRAEFENGPSLCTATLQRLACDCGLRLELDERGTTLDVGRRTRRIPPALRRAIRDRDHGRCRFPGCTMRGRLQIHHRRFWGRGGHTRKTNLFLVCLWHHRAFHEGGWRAEGDPDGELTFFDPRGRPVPEVAPPAPPSDPGAIRREHAAANVHIRPDTISAKWRAGEHLDLHHAVSALWHLDPPEWS